MDKEPRGLVKNGDEMMNGGFGTGLYSPNVAARVARINYQRFQAWAKAHLLHRTTKGKESLYSYHDLPLIRLIMRLRDRGFSTREIKKALDTIADMSGGDRDAWLQAAIYVEPHLIVVVLRDRQAWSPVAASKGPQKMALVFFPELREELERELVPPQRFRYIQIDPQVLGGAPVIKETRIPTRAISLLKESGEDPQRAYPHLTAEQIADALAYEEFLEAA